MDDQLTGEKNSFFSRRNIIVIVMSVSLLVAIPIGMYLVRKQTQLKSKASGTENVRITDGVRCDGGNCEVISDTIELELTSPFE